MAHQTKKKNGSGQEDPSCLGTKTMSFQDEESGKKKKGFMAVFHNAQQEELHLTCSDGKNVYEGIIKLEQVDSKFLESLHDNNNNKCVQLSDCLLDKTSEPVTVKCTLQTDDRFKMAIQYNTPQGKSKKAWGGHLTKQDSQDLFSFCKKLGASVNQAQQQRQIAQEGINQLEEDRDSWESKTKKIEGAWQQEKGNLLQNFVELYNQTLQELETTRKELADTKLALEESSDTNPPKKKTKKRLKEPVPEQPDDFDRHGFDDDAVNALADKKPVDFHRMEKVQRRAKKKDSDSDNDDESNGSVVSDAKKKLPFRKKVKAEDERLGDETDVESLSKKPSPPKASASNVQRKLSMGADDSDTTCLSSDDDERKVPSKGKTGRTSIDKNKKRSIGLGEDDNEDPPVSKKKIKQEEPSPATKTSTDSKDGSPPKASFSAFLKRRKKDPLDDTDEDE